MNKIKIAIVDDEKFIRESLKIILGTDPEIEILGLCGDGNEIYNLCTKKNLNVILMDIRMPLVDGVVSTRNIKRDFPNIKILILTTFDDDEYIFDALKNGASGYLLKDTSPDIIIDAIKSVNKGSIIIHPKVAARMLKVSINNQKKGKAIIQQEYELTNREINIISFIGGGLSNKEIAEKLYLSEGTIKNHITEIFLKLGLRDRTQIAIFERDNFWEFKC